MTGIVSRNGDAEVAHPCTSVLCYTVLLDSANSINYVNRHRLSNNITNYEYNKVINWAY